MRVHGCACNVCHRDMTYLNTEKAWTCANPQCAERGNRYILFFELVEGWYKDASYHTSRIGDIIPIQAKEDRHASNLASEREKWASESPQFRNRRPYINVGREKVIATPKTPKSVLFFEALVMSLVVTVRGERYLLSAANQLCVITLNIALDRPESVVVNESSLRDMIDIAEDMTDEEWIALAARIDLTKINRGM